MKIVVDEITVMLYNNVCCTDGLSPKGKATDSDSVIFKVRILVAQLREADEFFIRKVHQLFLSHPETPPGAERSM